MDLMSECKVALSKLPLEERIKVLREVYKMPEMRQAAIDMGGEDYLRWIDKKLNGSS